MQGIVFDIQRFALHDGPGIRTTVFLKGCPLRCQWCHNPESWSFAPQLAFRAEQCTNCMACVQVCGPKAHTARDAKHLLDWSVCTVNGECVPICPPGALRIVGEVMSVERVMDEVLRDAAYYRTSGGGLTLSGGEPLAQFGFARALLHAAKAEGLHTCVDTSGAAARGRIASLVDDVDLWLFDYKATDAHEHKRLTGVTNRHILSNLDDLYRRGARIVMRCPLIPGINDTPEHLRGIAAIAERYPNLVGVEIMAYHALGRDKAAEIGADNLLHHLPSADEATRTGWIETLHALGCTRATFG